MFKAIYDTVVGTTPDSGPNASEQEPVTQTVEEQPKCVETPAAEQMEQCDTVEEPKDVEKVDEPKEATEVVEKETFSAVEDKNCADESSAEEKDDEEKENEDEKSGPVEKDGTDDTVDDLMAMRAFLTAACPPDAPKNDFLARNKAATSSFYGKRGPSISAQMEAARQAGVTYGSGGVNFTSFGDRSLQPPADWEQKEPAAPKLHDARRKGEIAAQERFDLKQKKAVLDRELLAKQDQELRERLANMTEEERRKYDEEQMDKQLASIGTDLSKYFEKKK